jgi:glycosyltransferase involved in cell wall biosynthesis
MSTWHDAPSIENHSVGEENMLAPLRDTSSATLLSNVIAADEFAFIVHSHLRWDFVWQRPQQILSRLARDHRIVFIEEAFDSAGPATLELSEPYPNIVRVVPRLPGAARMTVDAQHELILPLLDRALHSHPLLAGRIDRVVEWFYSPMAAPCVLGRLPAEAVIYDCMDELANFRFAPPDIAEREQYLLKHADVVFTGGRSLYESKSRRHGNVHFFGCGVDAHHFGGARRADVVVPPELAELPGPVLGYFGVIDERLDYGLIERLSQAFSHGSMAMVGPLAKVDPTQLPGGANIHWLGQRAYEQLPALVKGFDVCLMPFAMNEATRYINPTKTLEYMAAGKPVVSTAIADVVRNFTPVVSVAGSHDEFVAAVKRALTQPDAERIAQGIAQAEGAGWDAIVVTMRGHIEHAVASRSQRVRAVV